MECTPRSGIGGRAAGRRSSHRPTHRGSIYICAAREGACALRTGGIRARGQEMRDPNTGAFERKTPAWRYRFGDLTLDLARRALWRGDEQLRLSNLTFELLRVLVEHAPHVVSHDELAHRTWGSKRVVTPENLAKRVMLLR